MKNSKNKKHCLSSLLSIFKSSNPPIFRRSGFTYMEMIVTMIIIIALSLLTYPIYTGRQGGKKDVALSEGYALLGYIINAQIAYFNEYGYFLNARAGYRAGIYTSGQGSLAYTSNDPILGINAINNRYFSYFNCYGNANINWDAPYTYNFTAIVKSTDYGTISKEYNLTKRFEPVVSDI